MCLKTRVRVHTPEYIGVREPMYSTAVGLIRYANMEDSYFGISAESQTVAASSEMDYPPASKREGRRTIKREKDKLHE